MSARLAGALCGNCRRPLAVQRSKAPVIIGIGIVVLLLSVFFIWGRYGGRNEESSNIPVPSGNVPSPTIQPTPAFSPTASPTPDSSSDYGAIIANLGDDKGRLAELKERLRKERNKEVRRQLQEEIEALDETITGLEGPCRDFFGGEGRRLGGKSKTARLVIKNQTPVMLNVTLLGEDGQNLSITPGESRNVDIGAGEYGVAVVPVSPTLQPCYGKWKLANRIYHATFVVGK